MNIIYVILIGIALAMDAFGVTLSIGVNSHIKRGTKIGYIISFAFFQFLLSFIGGAVGYYVDLYIVSIPKIIGGIVIGIVGLLMIIEGFKKKEETILEAKSMCFIMGISVSIDALVVGFTALNTLGGLMLLLVYTILIGLITALICTVGFILCRYIRKIDFIKKYADYIGGIVLIIFGIKMIL